MRLTRKHIAIIAALGALLLVAAGGCSTATHRDSAKTANGGAEQPLGDLATVAGEPGDAAPSAQSFDNAGSGGVSEQPPTDPKLDSVLDRKIVQSSSVDIGVKEVGHGFQEVVRFATTAGGFVASSSFSNVDDRQAGDVTIRVPGDKYQDVLQQIRGLGEVKTESSDANDITEEYTDLQARLRTLQATEQRYLELLAQATTVNDILTVQDRLDGVRGEIEQVQGRANLLDHLTTLATITVHLAPLGAAASGGGNLNPLEQASNAWEASLDALRGIATAALVAVAFSWWLVPVFVLGALGARRWLDRRPRPAANTTA